jgi:predicted lipase
MTAALNLNLQLPLLLSGGAMATLTAIDLKAEGIEPVRMFNFGSPRVGNHEFAEWASKYLSDHNRVTHYRDMVPHLPTHWRFLHIDKEWYEDEEHNVHTCSGYEDPKCAAQFLLVDIDDHMLYLNLDMSCETVSSELA